MLTLETEGCVGSGSQLLMELLCCFTFSKKMKERLHINKQ